LLGFGVRARRLGLRPLLLPSARDTPPPPPPPPPPKNAAAEAFIFPQGRCTWASFGAPRETGKKKRVVAHRGLIAERQKHATAQQQRKKGKSERFCLQERARARDHCRLARIIILITPMTTEQQQKATLSFLSLSLR
jgi:hypothetical protein